MIQNWLYISTYSMCMMSILENVYNVLETLYCIINMTFLNWAAHLINSSDMIVTKIVLSSKHLWENHEVIFELVFPMKANSIIKQTKWSQQ